MENGKWKTENDLKDTFLTIPEIYILCLLFSIFRFPFSIL